MERYYWGALSAAVGLGNSKLEALVAVFGSARSAYLADRQELLAARVYKEAAIDKFLKFRNLALPEQLQNFCERQQVRLMISGDADYPVSLRHIALPPKVLYIKGNLPRLDCSIGIVGSRRASTYGLKAAGDFAADLASAGLVFAADLASAGLVIVSGGAKGIDSAAHKGALQAGGSTIAVLGCGIDVVYPRENTALFEQICSNGALVTEFAPGTEPLAANFPSRNRIINGMTKGILVVEAAKKSGAMITAEFAADEGHEVYCIPGSIYLPNSIGCHSLIKSGAQLVDRPEDILNDLELNFGSKQKIENLSLFASEGAEAVSELAKQLMDIMTQEPVTLEELVELSGRSLAEISGELLDLQMQGKLGLADGRRYYRI